MPDQQKLKHVVRILKGTSGWLFAMVNDSDEVDVTVNVPVGAAYSLGGLLQWCAEQLEGKPDQPQAE